MAHHINSNKVNQKQMELEFILVGDSGVGKSAIIRRFCSDVFTNDGCRSTVGADFTSKIWDLEEQKTKIIFKIWDPSGQDTFRCYIPQYYRNVLGILIVYDVTERESFRTLPIWLQQIKNHAHEDVQKLLIGNKIDQREKRQVPKREGEIFGRRYGIEFMETSAELNINIDEAFVSLAEAVLKIFWGSDRVERSKETILLQPLKKCQSHCQCKDKANSNGRNCC